MRLQWFTCVRLSNPYLTVLIPPFNRIVHDLTVTSSAAYGSLKSAPVGRLRRIYLHLRHNIAFRLERIHGTLASGLVLVVLLVFTSWRIVAYFLIWLLGAALSVVPLRLPSRIRGISTAVAGLLLVLDMYLSLKFPINLFLSHFILSL